MFARLVVSMHLVALMVLATPAQAVTITTYTDWDAFLAAAQNRTTVVFNAGTAATLYQTQYAGGYGYKISGNPGTSVSQSTSPPIPGRIVSGGLNGSLGFEFDRLSTGGVNAFGGTFVGFDAAGAIASSATLQFLIVGNAFTQLRTVVDVAPLDFIGFVADEQFDALYVSGGGLTRFTIGGVRPYADQVPEPAAAALLALGLVVLAARRRRHPI